MSQQLVALAPKTVDDHQIFCNSMRKDEENRGKLRKRENDEPLTLRNVARKIEETHGKVRTTEDDRTRLVKSYYGCFTRDSFSILTIPSAEENA